MTYELAKELKEAGFPQTQPHPAALDYQDCTNPTLSELIEACGDGFNGLLRKGPRVWLAPGGQHIGFYGDEFLLQGDTPEEAVARLWLALNRKEA